VIVFDEATAGLDALAARAIMQLIRQSRDEGKTVLFSTHRMDEVNMLADDLGILHEGQLLYDGTYDRFVDEMAADTFEDEFIRRIEQADEIVATDGRVRSVA
jgi:sodium transport system ATP-binding protein